jgi:hypothetical protein
MLLQTYCKSYIVTSHLQQKKFLSPMVRFVIKNILSTFKWKNLSKRFDHKNRPTFKQKSKIDLDFDLKT